MFSGQAQPETHFAAPCGMFCLACTLRIGSNEDPIRVKRIAARYNVSQEALLCDGCRTDRRGPYCQQCKMIACTKDKGIAFCYECNEYSCAELKEIQAPIMPHRIELREDQVRLEEMGFEAWFQEKLDYYTCPECGAINSAYDLACRKCGSEPGNAFVKAHREAVEEYLKENAWISPVKDGE